MKITIDYEELNRIIKSYSCNVLGLSPTDDIEVTLPSEEYGTDLQVSFNVYIGELDEEC